MVEETEIFETTKDLSKVIDKLNITQVVQIHIPM